MFTQRLSKNSVNLMALDCCAYFDRCPFICVQEYNNCGFDYFNFYVIALL